MMARVHEKRELEPSSANCPIPEMDWGPHPEWDDPHYWAYRRGLFCGRVPSDPMPKRKPLRCRLGWHWWWDAKFRQGWCLLCGKENPKPQVLLAKD